MSLKCTAGTKTPANTKYLQSFFEKPGRQVPRDDSSMDWSADIHEVQASPTPRVPPARENMSSPHAQLHNRDAKGKGRTDSNDSGPSLLNYSGTQPAIPSSWDGAHHALSIFGTDQSAEIDATHMAQSLSRVIEYIVNNPADKKVPAREFENVVKGFWSLISAIYASKWDLLPVKNGKTFRALVGGNILNNYIKLGLVKLPEAPKPQNSTPLNDTNHKTPSSPPPSKKAGSNKKKALTPKPTNTMKKSYAEASKVNNSSNIEDVIQVKEAFPELSADEVGKMLKAKNNNGGTKKPKINMTTRGQSRREVIIPMAKSNAELIVNSAQIHISNINKCLKNSKSIIVADFIHYNASGIIITMNTSANDLDLSTIKNYLKNVQNVNPDFIESSCLPKSKSYMKIVGLPYSSELGGFKTTRYQSISQVR